jgi:hypothetical protein
MPLDQVTLTLFATFNSVRILAYIPQIRKAAIDVNGASAISFTTWGLFFLSNLSTVAYAVVNRADLGMAFCFAGNAACCVVILAIAVWKRYRLPQTIRFPARLPQIPRYGTADNRNS